MKETVCTAAGLLGAWLVNLFGGWSASLGTLIFLMMADYLSGIIIAGVFNSSPKTSGGGLDSKVGWRGLCKKAMILVFVLAAHRLDLALGTAYLKDAVIIGFMANELLSLIENAGIMGLPLPKGLTRAIEILKNKENQNDGN